MREIEGVYDGETVRPLEKLDVKPNTRVIIMFPVDKERSRAATAQTRLEDVAGCLYNDGPARTLDDMEAAIERGARERRS